MPQHIALVCAGGYIAGKEIVALELADVLRQRGYDLHVVTTKWADGEFARRLDELSVKKHPMRLGFISATPRFAELRMTAHQLFYLPNLWWSYYRFLRNVRPDRVIHTNWQHILLLAPFLRSSRDSLWVHEIIPAKRQYRTVFSILSSKVTRFIAVSDAVRQSLVALGLPDSSITIIYNGLADFTLALKLSDDIKGKVRIGIAGQIGAWKGHEDLILAFGRVMANHPACELHIFGTDKGTYVHYLRQLIADCRLENNVKWHGFTSSRGEIFSQMDICVTPSRTPDPLPTVAIEAAMAGIPAVATRTGGLPEIIEDGVTGLLVEPGNPKGLADAIESLVRNPALRVKMGEAAKHRARHYFGFERFGTEFAALLGKC